MQDYAKNYIEKIETFLKEKKEPLKLILIGGLALSFYGEMRYTVDIDGEVIVAKIYFSH